MNGSRSATRARRSGLVLAWAGALALGAATPASADAAPSTLRAVGNGLTFVTPDAATVNISVARAGASADAARGRENARLQAILAGLRATGVPPADVQTANISLSREGLGPARRGHRRRFRFVASASLTVNTKRVELLSRIFAAASQAGADSFDGPSYTVSDPSAGKLAAEAAAVRDARRRADSAAAAAGVRVTGVQSIDLDPSSPSSTSPAAGAPSTGVTAPKPGVGHAPIPTPVNRASRRSTPRWTSSSSSGPSASSRLVQEAEVGVKCQCTRSRH